MRVAINITPLRNNNSRRGVGCYTLSLLEELKKDKEIEVLEFTKTIPKEADLVHYPFFDPFFLTLPLIRNKPTVVTAHDLIPLVFPDKFSRGFRGELEWQIQKLALKSCQAIITDSDNSKKDIIKILGVNTNKVFSIPLAAGKSFRQIRDKEVLNGIKIKYALPDKFVLYVGDVNWNKNIENLLKAATEVKLVLVGKSIQSYNARGVIKLGYVSEEDLVGIYNLAGCYVQPSFYEGFGLPVLEALSCGCPVACSNTSSLIEVGGNAVWYFDPNNIKDMTDKIVQAINNPKKNSDWVKNFSWDKTAMETIEVYKKCL